MYELHSYMHKLELDLSQESGHVKMTCSKCKVTRV